MKRWFYVVDHKGSIYHKSHTAELAQKWVEKYQRTMSRLGINRYLKVQAL